jgi:hypothetical protein
VSLRLSEVVKANCGAENLAYVQYGPSLDVVYQRNSLVQVVTVPQQSSSRLMPLATADVVVRNELIKFVNLRVTAGVIPVAI